MNERKVIIWDYNGTIVDDIDLCVDIENYMLAERNMNRQFTAEDYRRNFCFPVIDYYYKIGYTFEDETYADISEEFNRMYSERFHECRLCEGFEEKIREAKDRGYENVIISACMHDDLIRQCEQLGISAYFEEMFGMDNNLAESKTQMAAEWMENADIRPDNCLYIGDTLHDLETAHALGIGRCVLVSTGHQSYERLKEAHENTVHSLKEVVL